MVSKALVTKSPAIFKLLPSVKVKIPANKKVTVLPAKDLVTEVIFVVPDI